MTAFCGFSEEHALNNRLVKIVKANIGFMVTQLFHTLNLACIMHKMTIKSIFHLNYSFE